MRLIIFESSRHMRAFWWLCIVMAVCYAIFLLDDGESLAWVLGQAAFGVMGLVRESYIARRSSESSTVSPGAREPSVFPAEGPSARRAPLGPIRRTQLERHGALAMKRAVKEAFLTVAAVAVTLFALRGWIQLDEVEALVVANGGIGSQLDTHVVSVIVYLIGGSIFTLICGTRLFLSICQITYIRRELNS